MRNKNNKRTVFIAIGAIMLVVAAVCGIAYFMILGNNTLLNEKVVIYIKTGSTYDDVLKTIVSKQLLKNPEAFDQLARKMKYPERVKPGKYIIKPRSSNLKILTMLRNGAQEPVNLVLRSNIRTAAELAKLLAKNLEMDSATVVAQLNDSLLLASFGTDKQNVLGLCVPNTYQMYWNTTFEKFIERMQNEGTKFWASRTAQLSTLQMTQQQVITLASIVEEETKIKTDKAMVAGVYINRLKKDIMLQADPTVKFSIGDFAIKRVLFKHLETESPYNTYRNKGLPPGPICIPTVESIDAVLNYTQHNYIFFCAKEDFSGYSNFAVTNAEHELNRDKFIKAMNERGIK